MTAYVAFLRGINLGNRRVRMPTLAALLVGLRPVVTVDALLAAEPAAEETAEA